MYEQPAPSKAQPASQRRTTRHDQRSKAGGESLQTRVQAKYGRNDLPTQDFHADLYRATSDHGQPYADTAASREIEESIDGMAAIADPEETRTRFFGPSSNIAFLREISGATEKLLEAAISNHVNGHSERPRPFVSRRSSPVSSQLAVYPTPTEPVNTRSLPTDREARHLIGLFFSDTGTLFPFVHELHVFNIYAAAVRHDSSGIAGSELALLNVIFAIATYISALPDFPMDGNAKRAEVFFARARLLISDTKYIAASFETGISLQRAVPLFAH